MGAILVVAFLTIPILELVLFIYVEGKVGLARLLLGIVATALLGAFLVRRQGLTVLSQVRSEVATGEMPARALVHGALVLVGGALLLTPGFLTDAVGFSLMVPSVREGIRRLGTRFFQRRVIIIR